MKIFLALWFSQLLAAFGNYTTAFALGVAQYQAAGSVTRLALVSFFTSLPVVVLSPVAGALVDRWKQRRSMLISATGAGLCAVCVALLVRREPLPVAAIYALLLTSATFQCLRWPALASSVTLLVPKAQFGRASGLLQLGLSAAQALAPLVATSLLVAVGLSGVALTEVALAATAVLLLLVITLPARGEGDAAPRSSSLAADIAEGWRFLRQRPPLLALLGLFTGTNFLMGMVTVLLTPIVLGFGTTTVLGRVTTIGGLGLIVGGLAMAIWGGPQRRLRGILLCLGLQGVALFVAGSEPSAWWVATGAAVFLGAFAVISASSQAIWQSKVPQELQGRVFALRRTLAVAAIPLAQLATGPLADHLFEPLLRPEGALAASLGPYLGTGPGRGAALLVMLLGLALFIAALALSRSQTLAAVEALPDATER